MVRRSNDHNHRYPPVIEPWDPQRARCLGCNKSAPESIMKALFNQTRATRTRRDIVRSWRAFERNAQT